MTYPSQVQQLIDSISRLPGVVGCFCSLEGLDGVEPGHLSLPGEFGDLPQVAIHRTGGGRTNEVMIQTEVILDRSPQAWLTLEFLAWWVRDWARSGYEIQMRPMALPPKAHEIQLGRTLKFFIEDFLIEDGEQFDKSLEAAAAMGDSITSNFEDYDECFQNPAEFTGDVESI